MATDSRSEFRRLYSMSHDGLVEALWRALRLIEDLEQRLEHEIQHGAACVCIECRVPGSGDIGA